MIIEWNKTNKKKSEYDKTNKQTKKNPPKTQETHVEGHTCLHTKGIPYKQKNRSHTILQVFVRWNKLIKLVLYEYRYIHILLNITFSVCTMILICMFPELNIWYALLCWRIFLQSLHSFINCTSLCKAESL